MTSKNNAELSNQSKTEQAADFFHGEAGYNCAQAVLKAYQAESGMSELTIQSAKVAGGGRAKGGTCGALYAAQIILGDGEHTESVEQKFIQEVGSNLCSDIKRSECGCRGYVQVATQLTEQHLDKINKDDPEYAAERAKREIDMLPQPSTISSK